MRERRENKERGRIDGREKRGRGWREKEKDMMKISDYM
jgi:hypothetical protein